ncbi:response regulator receiver domain [Marinomonas polaris]|uniref:response regulator receiver domain n=1 Tax=Marinomonas polaris TaxID=293552 RepID=UPI0035138AC3
MTAAYKQKITQAFRDNAIRSVLLIDDEYYPYGNLVEHQSSLLEKISEIKSIGEYESEKYREKLSELLNSNFDIKRSQVAKKFVNFFHENKRICDVESDTDNLDHERIRKSDLIVLDYYLKSDGQGNRAESSLNLIYDLSNSKHMNIVVVYTGENLNQVWLEIATALRGSKNVDVLAPEKKVPNEKWNENKDEWLDIWEKFVDDNMKSDFLLGCPDLKKINKEFKKFCTDEGIEVAFSDHLIILLENSIDSLNHNNKPFKIIDLHGEKGIWLQAGNVFVALCSKQEETPEGVWECVEKALHSWNPSFYRVVTSELQNQIEDANLSMEKSISYRDRDQMAFLWGILQTEDKDKERITRELLGNIATEALDRILYDSNFISDVVETASQISDESIDYVSRDKFDEKPHKDFQRKILELVEKNVKKDISIPEDEKYYEIAHSYNERLSTTPHFPKYITTGSILCDEDNNWYICVTPSCNTVPNQMTDASASALTPHRSLTLAKLVKVNPIKNAIHNAHHSSYIYISSDDDKVLAFSVLKEESKLPDLVKVIVMNHDAEAWESDGRIYKDITIFETKSDQEVANKITLSSKKFYPIALLKPAYAARYQNIQSHYEGRIGVDFITLDLSDSEQPVGNENTIEGS